MKPLTITEARYKMLLARKRIERANAKIKQLKQFIESKEGRKEDNLKRRNAELFKKYQAGKSVKEITIEYGLSSTRVRQIIDRIEYNNRKKG